MTIPDLGNPATYLAGFPYDEVAELRRRGPVAWIPEPPSTNFAGGPGFWYLMRHADVVAAGRNPEVFSSEEGGTWVRNVTPQELATQDFEEGRVKHVRSAVRSAKEGDERGVAYLRKLALEQVDLGARYFALHESAASELAFHGILMGPSDGVPLVVREVRPARNPDPLPAWTRRGRLAGN